MLAPVVLFAYKRDKHVHKALEALNENSLASQTDLFIYIDGHKTEEDIHQVEKVKEEIHSFRLNSNFNKTMVYESDYNKGLANSIISGVTNIIKSYGKVIVLEDDLLVSPDFLQFMNDGLDYYQEDEKVGAISGFCPNMKKKNINGDVFKARTGNSCGWGTWEQVWEHVDWEVSDYHEFNKNASMRKIFDEIQYGISAMLERQMCGELDSWAVRWDYSFLKRGLWTIYPIKSKVQNIGFDKEGTTTKLTIDRRRKVLAKSDKYKLVSLENLCDMTAHMAKFYKPRLTEKTIDYLMKTMEGLSMRRKTK